MATNPDSDAELMLRVKRGEGALYIVVPPG